MFRDTPNLEQRLLLLARTRGHSPAAERAVAGFSRLGEHATGWVAIGLLGGLAAPARRAEWRRARRIVIATYGINTAIKLVVRRPRPQLAGLPPLTGTTTALSFPSAHAATSYAGALAYSRLGLAPQLVYPLAATMALSRLYLGVHYPSDVVAGALLGTAVAALAGRGEAAL